MTFYFNLLSPVGKDNIDDLFSMGDSNWKNDSQGHAPLEWFDSLFYA